LEVVMALSLDISGEYNHQVVQGGHKANKEWKQKPLNHYILRMAGQHDTMEGGQ